jgi:prepilin signal peptidase PulO-like enzyme (type II secretory pathway)
MIELVNWLVVIIVSCLGPLLASFFTASIMRETDLTKAEGERSQCDHCGKQLPWYELIPIFSFILLRGKCSKCKQPIDIRIFLAELTGLVFFVLLGVFFATTITKNAINLEVLTALVIQFVAATLILYLAIYDLLTFTIPARGANLFVLFAVVVNVIILAVRLFFPNQLTFLGYGEVDNLVSGLIAGAFVWGLILVTKQKGIGSGDLYLAVVIGLMLGWPGIISAFYVMILMATAVGLVYAYQKKRFKGLLVPLVPFIGLGYLAAVVWGQAIFGFLFLQI